MGSKRFPIYVVTWDMTKFQVESFEILHGANVIGMNIVFVDKCCPASVECKWCDDLGARVMSRQALSGRWGNWRKREMKND